MTAEERTASLQRLRDGRERLLITTNVMARGIDVEEVESQLFIRTFSHFIITVGIKLSQSLFDLKKCIQFKEGLDIKAQKVIFKGKVLNNDFVSLQSLGIQNNCNLSLVLGLMGGFDNEVKTFDLYCEGYRKEKRSYILAELLFEDFNDGFSEEGGQRNSSIIFHQMKPNLKIHLKQSNETRNVLKFDLDYKTIRESIRERNIRWTVEETIGGRNCPETYEMRLRLHNNETSFDFNGAKAKLFLNKSNTELVVKQFNVIRETHRYVLNLGINGFNITSDPKLFGILFISFLRLIHYFFHRLSKSGSQRRESAEEENRAIELINI